MPLPIPNILENAGNAIKAAKEYCESPNDANISKLEDALKKIHHDDLLAVMNEVGKVYVGMYNMQIQQIGSRANLKTGNFEVVLSADFGIGPVAIITPIPVEQAKQLVEGFKAELAIFTSGTHLITDIGSING